MTHEYAPYGRVALDAAALRQELGAPAAVWSELRVLSECDSTQQVAKQALDAGAVAPLAVMADLQTQGRGRLDRRWEAPAGSAVLLSAALPLPDHDPAFTLRVGVAVARVLRAAGVPVQLKWPNDLVLQRGDGLAKLGGIIAEVHGAAVVVGIGINVDLRDDELPTVQAISCRQLGLRLEREPLLAGILTALAGSVHEVTLADYRDLCVTIGQVVQVSQLAGPPVCGTVVAVDDAGALVLVDGEGIEHRLTVGDVQLVRGSEPA